MDGKLIFNKSEEDGKYYSDNPLIEPDFSKSAYLNMLAVPTVKLLDYYEDVWYPVMLMKPKGFPYPYERKERILN